MRIGSGIRQLGLLGVVIATLVTGVLPFDADASSIALAWSVVAIMAAASRRSLARGSMGFGDWVRQGWRTVGSELSALRMADGAAGRPVDLRDTRLGVRSFGRLRVLTAAVVALDLALLARAATLFDGDLLPAFTTFERILVLGFGLAMLVPMVDVLQMIVRRVQRRRAHRVAVAVPIRFAGQHTTTLDLTEGGAGIRLPYEPALGSVADFVLELRRPDGEVDEIAGTAEVRSTRDAGEELVRVGLVFRALDAEGRRRLIEFCTIDDGKVRDRRSRARLQAMLPIQFGADRHETADLSPKGVGVVMREAPVTGDPLEFTIDLPRIDAEPVRIDGTAIARAVIQRADGSYRVGFEFEELDAHARAALTRYCAIDHDLLRAARGGVHIDGIVPADLSVVRSSRSRSLLNALTALAALIAAVAVFVGPAATGASASATVSVEVCVVTSTGSPVAGAVVGDAAGATTFGPTAVDGCVDATAPQNGSAFVIEHDGVAVHHEESLVEGARVVVSTVATRICLSDGGGLAAPGVALRVFGAAWHELGTSDSAGLLETELLPADVFIEASLDGGRFLTPLAVADSRAVAVRLGAVVAESGASVTEIDAGEGWQPFTDEMTVAPGRVSVRLADGTVVRVAVESGQLVSVPSGSRTPIASAVTCDEPAGPTNPTSLAPTSSTTEPDTSSTTSSRTEDSPSTTVASPSTTTAPTSTSTTTTSTSIPTTTTSASTVAP